MLKEIRSGMKKQSCSKKGARRRVRKQQLICLSFFFFFWLGFPVSYCFWTNFWWLFQNKIFYVLSITRQIFQSPPLCSSDSCGWYLKTTTNTSSQANFAKMCKITNVFYNQYDIWHTLSFVPWSREESLLEENTCMMMYLHGEISYHQVCHLVCPILWDLLGLQTKPSQNTYITCIVWMVYYRVFFHH